MYLDFTPIASKSFGIDAATGLEKKVIVWQQCNDVKSQKIICVYDIVLVAPTGKVVSVLLTSSYERNNISETETHEASNKFDELRGSQIGQGIAQLIQADLNAVNSFETLDEDLQQKLVEKIIEG